MIWSFSAGRIGGTAVRIHVTFLVFLAWLGLDAFLRSGVTVALHTIIFVLAVFASVLAHEFGHVAVARTFGVTTPDITLYPFGGIARLNTIPQQPMQELLIAVAGPAVNIVIVAGLLLAGATIKPESLTQDQADLASRLATTNLVLAVFNMIPAFPMDGGRVVRAALSVRIGFDRATRLAANVGHWIALLLAVIGIFTNPMLIVVAGFIFLAATAEVQATALRSFSTNMPVSRAMITEFATLKASATTTDAVDLFLRTSQQVVPVVADSGALLGILEINDLFRELSGNPGKPRPVSEFARGDIPRLPSRVTLDDALRLLREKAGPAVAIMDDDGRLSGLVTAETLSDMLLLHEASASVFDGRQSSRDRTTAPSLS